MLMKTIKLVRTIAWVLLLLPATFAQQPLRLPNQPDWVEVSGFKGKIFDIKHRDPGELVSALKPLGSGFKGAIIQPNSEYKTLTVRDFPENIAAIEEAIKRLDTPRPPRPISPDVQITAYVLIATNVEAPGNVTPPDLKDVISQLQSMLNYKSYQLLTPIVQRTRLDGGQVNSNGTAILPDRSLGAEYRFQIDRLLSDRSSDDKSVIGLHNLYFSIKGARPPDQDQIGNAEIRTGLTIRDGEKVVVGTASLKDRALILVLIARVLK